MIYLIDYENVKNEVFNDDSRLQAEDTVIIFYSKNAFQITLDTILHLQNLNVRLEVVKLITTAKDALDILLAFYLGTKITQLADATVSIVSRDKGFDSLVTQSFINTCSIERIESLARVQRPLLLKKDSTKSVSVKESLPNVQVVERNESLACVQGELVTRKDSKKTASLKKSSPKEDISIELVEVQDIINKYAMKSDIHNALVKQYGAEATKVIYPQIGKKLARSSSKTLSIDSNDVQEIIHRCSSVGDIHNRLMAK